MNNGHVENVSRSVVNNFGTIVNNARFEVRAETRLLICFESTVEGSVPFNTHRNAVLVACDCEAV